MAKKRYPKTKHEAFYGIEPEVSDTTDENYRIKLMHHLNWYGTIQLKDRRPWFDAWADQNGYPKSDVKSIPSEYLSTASSVARLISRGFPFREDNLAWLINTTTKLIEDFRKPQEIKKDVLTQKQIDDEAKLSELFSEYDSIVDKCIESGRKQKVQVTCEHTFSKAELSCVIHNYKSSISEFKSIDFADTENGYYWTPAFTAKMIALHEDIIAHATSLMPVVKPRKPRRKKVWSSDKLVKNLNYKVEDKKLGIKSIPPESIINCNVLYLFNTKTRKIIRYNSTEGFSVKGSTLQNFDETSSQKTIRKPKEFLKTFMPATKTQSRKQFSNINAVESKLTGRINKECVILKLY